MRPGPLPRNLVRNRSSHSLRYSHPIFVGNSGFRPRLTHESPPAFRPPFPQCSEFRTTFVLAIPDPFWDRESTRKPDKQPESYGDNGDLMRFTQGQVWRCLNDACGAELTVTLTGELDEGGNPRCCCGSLMKMPYEQPKLRLTEDSQEVRRLLQRLATVLR
jgi:hypothetical protein